MPQLLADRIVTYHDRARQAKAGLSGKNLFRYYEIRKILERYDFEAIEQSACETNPQAITPVFFITSAYSSPLLPKAYVTIFCDTVSVRFIVARNANHIIVDDISTYNGPGDDDGPRNQGPSPRDVLHLKHSYRRLDATETSSDKIAAKLRDFVEDTSSGQRLITVNRAAINSEKPNDKIAIQTNANRKQSLISRALDWVKSANKVMQFGFKGYRADECTAPHARDLVQRVDCAIVSGRLMFAHNADPNDWSSISTLLQEIRDQFVLNVSQEDLDGATFSIFYCSEDNALHGSFKSISLLTTDANNTPYLIVHAPHTNTAPCIGVDLVTCAAIAAASEQDSDELEIICSGRTPFDESERDGGIFNMAVWNKVFKIKHLVRPNSGENAPKLQGIEMILNHAAQVTIAEYFEAAQARFRDGEPRSDAYVWRELAHSVGQTRDTAELSIVIRDFGAGS